MDNDTNHLLHHSSHVKSFFLFVAGLVLIAFAYAAIVYVQAYSKSIEPSSFRSFSVTAQGKVIAIPDVAQFSFSVITQGGVDIASLQETNVRKVNDAIAFVKSSGVEDKDIKTLNFSLEPRYQYFSCPPRPFGSEVEPCPPPEIVGYTVRQTVQVKVRDFDTIGDVVSGVVENGANSVSQLSFTIDDPDAKQAEARNEAIQKARQKAEDIAKAGGFSVGRLLSLQEGGFYPSPIYRFESAQAGIGGASDAIPAPTIEPGSQDVVVSVTLVYEID